MKNQLLLRYIGILILLNSQCIYAQQGIVSGTLKDEEGLPLPGVNIIIKGTTTGTQTDFDGNYNISCAIGDVLTFSYVGFGQKEILVTAKMFGGNDSTEIIKKQAVEPIKSKSYGKAITNNRTTGFMIPDIGNDGYTYNKDGPNYFNHYRIKDIVVDNPETKVKLTYFTPDIFYETGWNSTLAMQFIQNSNLPRLQKEFSQGQPFNNQNTFFGPESGVPFSYGPRLSTLRFDGLSNPFDQNGRLIPNTNNDGAIVNAYDNEILRTVVKTGNDLFFNVSTQNHFIGILFNSKKNRDIFNRENSRFEKVTLNYNNAKNSSKKLIWDTFITYTNTIDNQPNLNGFLNTLLLNTWATPTSFDSKQGTILPDNKQRTFSANNFNNPNWLLENNRNRIRTSDFVASLQNTLELSDNTSLYANTNYTSTKNTQEFGLIPDTIGFLDGYGSTKDFNSDAFNSLINFKFNSNGNKNELELESTVQYTYNSLKYSLKEETGFTPFSFNNPNSTTIIEKNVVRNTVQFTNSLSYSFSEYEAKASITHNAITSSIQNNKWFLPSFQFEIDLSNFLDSYWLYDIKLHTSTSFEAQQTPLYYANQSHNSLDITPIQSLALIANDDLFVSNDIELEEKNSFTLGTNLVFELFNRPATLEANYYNYKHKKSVFPVINENQFQLKNVADINQYGFESTFSFPIYFKYNFSYTPKLVFSTYRNKVSKIYGNNERVPMAGFSTISKNLIKGQPAGVLVGSAYARDNQNNIIIDQDGFPLISSTPQIIGDPTPDFSLGFSNSFDWERLQFSFLIDFQKGGDVWNGTQSALNYLGTSQQSAEEREISQFVYDGVDQQGQINTIPVDFANPENDIQDNRFVRYGFEGVAEEAIVKGTYLNLKSIQLSYQFRRDTDRDFIRLLDIGIYAKNIFTYTKYRGASPYSSLFDHSSGQQLQFFNTPLTSEVGLQVKIKI
ncbi:carboxypeptidase-like regulatory domain-containing protein [Aquimarina aggregata]|uniref:carboxypeptidase-like regulatory domain-containing protein n=1 Tax=Aquimarina aggregata TaxID=1642818 RepID=UPI00248FCB18|nr:carboxypeptidase-like regulatory domain-containing protein [Aquimarina aggregata]